MRVPEGPHLAEVSWGGGDGLESSTISAPYITLQYCNIAAKVKTLGTTRV